MGTRGLSCAFVDGQFKVAQYGQWDHYPSGQGTSIAVFIENLLNEGRLDEFTEAIRECRFLTNEEVEQKQNQVIGKTNGGWINMEQSDKLLKELPELHRDTGSGVFSLILNNGVREIHNDVQFAVDGLFCEWAYVIDLDKKVLEVYQGAGSGGKKGPGKFSDLKLEPGRTNSYGTVQLYATIPFKSVMKGIDKVCRKYEKEN